MKFSILTLDSLPILKQLYIEEALLRADDRNICIISTGAPPSIVMGISGKIEELVNQAKVLQDNIPIVKRFTGGGTVFIDPSTIFITLICNAKDIPIPPQPKPILEWGSELYKPIFEGMELRENDFVFGERKFAGNAQYIQKGRWLLHTSFLWDFTPLNMDYLKLPPRRPSYRQDRDHAEFLCTLKERFCSKKELMQKLQNHLGKKPLLLEEIEQVLARPHRRSSTLYTP